VLVLPVIALGERVLAPRTGRIAIVAITALASLVHARRTFASAEDDVSGLVRTAVGLEDQRDFLTRHIDLFPMFENVNRALPADARVLLSSYCRGFHLDRTTYCADFVQGSLRLTTWSEFVADVRHLGVSHVLAPRALASESAAPPTDVASVAVMVREREQELVRRLLADHGRLLASGADHGLYAIDLDTPR
jgi:hypothetical protein